jgi:hypothetical protein
MAVGRTHRYTVDPADLEELIARRATLIAAVQAAHPGLAQTLLTRLEDGPVHRRVAPAARPTPRSSTRSTSTLSNSTPTRWPTRGQHRPCPAPRRSDAPAEGEAGA